MKKAVCSKCGKVFPHQMIPDDAEGVICFACDQKERKK